MGNEKSAGCADCHGSHLITEVTAENSPLNLHKTAETCSTCHEEEGKKYASSVHARSLITGASDAATCVSCHKEHNTPLLSEKKLFKGRTVYQLCGKCHSNVALMDHYGIQSAGLEMLLKGSVHAQQVLSGNDKAPTCVDCHRAHDVMFQRDANSPSNFLNVANTCGHCHPNEKEQWMQSIHGSSAMRGHKDSPVCTDCHGEHVVLGKENDNSPVSVLNVSKNVCGRCHSTISISDRFGLKTGRLENYYESYHGLATQNKSKKAANCSSCHGNHLVLASSDPRSTVSKTRLVETCGKCHPGISDNILFGQIHTDTSLTSNSVEAWVPRIYIPLIVLVIGGMLLHNGLIFWRSLRKKYRELQNQILYERFSKFEQIMHILLLSSFIILAITGFALVSPNAWWVKVLTFLQMTEEARRWIHRIAGCVMIIVSLIYGFFMVFTRPGREETKSFFPVWRDVVHFFQNMAYYLGFRSEPPEYDRFDYTEKAEFWALVWGVIIMGATGILLWFPIYSFQFLPKWAVDVAELIHFYEAILATLAIIVWHFFFVIFHPDHYPMNLTWFTRKVSEKDLKHHHPLEFERILEQQKKDDENITE